MTDFLKWLGNSLLINTLLTQSSFLFFFPPTSINKNLYSHVLRVPWLLGECVRVCETWPVWTLNPTHPASRLCSLWMKVSQMMDQWTFHQLNSSSYEESSHIKYLLSFCSWLWKRIRLLTVCALSEGVNYAGKLPVIIDWIIGKQVFVVVDLWIYLLYYEVLTSSYRHRSSSDVEPNL